jgi:outer membrane protein OmpA-like peptidoglycan-associated protein
VEINAIPNARVVIEGHTDSDGSDDYNQRLSEARATAVADFLVDSGGVSRDIVGSRGYGEGQPVAPNDTAQNKAMNRRVEAVIIVE